MDHGKIEKNLGLMLVLTMIAISIGGGGVNLPPFFFQGIREGCYLCHSQMIRPFRDEAMRYGHYSLAAESQYDHPFQWGSKRTGPDLARVGKKYSNEWQGQAFIVPRALVPVSGVPNYA